MDNVAAETTLIAEIANFIVLLATLVAISYSIVHMGRVKIFQEKKSCANCYWLYNKDKVMFCADPTPPFMAVNRKIYREFRCGRWSKKHED